MNDKEFQDIKPEACPFCGRPDKMGMAKSKLDGTHFAICQECGATGPAKESAPEAAKAWNTRITAGSLYHIALHEN